MSTIDKEQLDRLAVADVIQRERAARDNGLWSEMKACWEPDGVVDVSWFHGNSAAFIEASIKSASKPMLTFHQMSPSIVTVKQDRAIADSGCAVHAMTKIDGVDISVISYMRLLSRARRHSDGWLITGLRAFYLRVDYRSTKH